MRRPTTVLAALAAAAALTAAPAVATGCPLLTDPAGDARWPGGIYGQGLYSPVWDVVSADVATGPATLVGVVRVAGLADEGVAGATYTGSSWRLGWTLGATRHSLALVVVADGRVSASYVRAPLTGGPTATVPVTAAVDRAAGTVTWTAQRSDVPELATPGAEFDDLTALTAYWSNSTDQAFVDGVVYTDGDPGCVSAA